MDLRANKDGAHCQGGLSSILVGLKVHAHIVEHFTAWFPIETITNKAAVNVRECSFGAHAWLAARRSAWVMIGMKFSFFPSSLSFPPPLLL